MNDEALNYLEAITDAFGPDEVVQFAQGTWGQMHATIKKLLAERDRLANELVAAEIRIDNDSMKLERIKSQEPVAWALPEITQQHNGQTVKHTPYHGYPVALFLAAGAQTIPAGYQLVPVEPTMAIRMAYTNATYDDSESTEARNVWAAMLAAAKEQS